MKTAGIRGEVQRCLLRVAVWSLAAALLGACAAPAQSAQSTQPVEATAQVTAPDNPSTPKPSPTPHETAIWATSMAITAIAATNEPTEYPSPMLTPTRTCEESWCLYEGHFLLHRPIQDAPYGQVDPTYRYASTEGGAREPHRGVEFQAPAGDRVLAAGDGIVERLVKDGEEVEPEIGSGYGNLVILKHQLPGVDKPVYSLYAHLAEIKVTQGEAVNAGEPIGSVGATGEATGPHLHFEVRVGSDRQADTQNPEMWLMPTEHESSGLGSALAGRIQKADGSLVTIQNIVVQAIDPDTGRLAEPIIYLESYTNPSYQGDDELQENFAVGDLPHAWYRVAFQYEGRQIMVSAPVPAGKLAMVVITVP